MNILYILFIYSKTKENPVQLSIDNRSDQPIYEQIAAQIKAQIISVITTKRAYEELERQGFIYTVPAKGSFVAQRNMELLREENLKKIEAHLKEALALAASCRLTLDALCEMLRVLDEEG